MEYTALTDRGTTGLTHRGFTAKVQNAYANIENPRLKFIVSDLIKYLHAYVRDTKVTDEEWEFAWDFMKRMADITGTERNEFILLADVLGVSHSISITPDGKKKYPFGEDAIGYIHYSDSGIMAVQISRRSRDKAQYLSGLKRDYLAYFGRYEIDTEKQVVRHFVEGQLFVGDHPDVLERKYRFDGDLMSLRPVDGSNREILWQRIQEDFVAIGPSIAESALRKITGTKPHQERRL
ncbi:MAG: dioxygenase [Syntrophobacteraceae bacterium]